MGGFRRQFVINELSALIKRSLKISPLFLLYRNIQKLAVYSLEGGPHQSPARLGLGFPVCQTVNFLPSFRTVRSKPVFFFLSTPFIIVAWTETKASIKYDFSGSWSYLRRQSWGLFSSNMYMLFPKSSNTFLDGHVWAPPHPHVKKAGYG